MEIDRGGNLFLGMYAEAAGLGITLQCAMVWPLGFEVE